MCVCVSVCVWERQWVCGCTHIHREWGRTNKMRCIFLREISRSSLFSPTMHYLLSVIHFLVLFVFLSLVSVLSAVYVTSNIKKNMVQKPELEYCEAWTTVGPDWSQEISAREREGGERRGGERTSLCRFTFQSTKQKSNSGISSSVCAAISSLLFAQRSWCGQVAVVCPCTSGCVAVSCRSQLTFQFPPLDEVSRTEA